MKNKNKRELEKLWAEQARKAAKKAAPKKATSDSAPPEGGENSKKLPPK